MLESVYKQYADIESLLDRRGSNLMDAVDEGAMSDLIKFLTPFKEATADLETEAWPTLHLYLLWVARLGRHLQEDEGDTAEIRQLKSRVHAL